LAKHEHHDRSLGERRNADLSPAHLDSLWRHPGFFAQQPEDDAGEVAFEGAESFAAGLALGLPAFEVHAGASVPAALDDRDLVQRGVQLAVAVPAEPMTTLSSRGRFDRRDTGETGELRVVAEAADPSGLADDLRRDQRAAALQRQQLRGVTRHSDSDFALELVRVARQCFAPPHEVARDPDLNGLLATAEAPCDALEPDLPVQGAGGS
jgi:hypothetical protein